LSDFFIPAAELAARLGDAKLKVVDGAWYLPAQNRDAAAEYAQARIPGAVRFDIDEVSDKSSDLPHMLPSPEDFARAAGAIGISRDDDIVVYDGPGVFSSARVWWTFRVMGALSVRILAGGFDRWKAAGYPVETGAPSSPKPAVFQTAFASERVATIDDMRANLRSGHSLVLDARPYARYAGQAPEPRPGLRGGHIPGSKSLPADRLVRDGALVPGDELRAIFRELALDAHREAITTCGSGVTAAIISLALSSSGHDNHRLYDGSWAEWGKAEAAPTAKWIAGQAENDRA
jgi:thiosulfate/3-mercaptopyruvate sulfurtransferase